MSAVFSIIKVWANFSETGTRGRAAEVTGGGPPRPVFICDTGGKKPVLAGKHE